MSFIPAAHVVSSACAVSNAASCESARKTCFDVVRVLGLACREPRTGERAVGSLHAVSGEAAVSSASGELNHPSFWMRSSPIEYILSTGRENM